MFTVVTVSCGIQGQKQLKVSGLFRDQGRNLHFEGSQNEGGVSDQGSSWMLLFGDVSARNTEEHKSLMCLINEL